MDRISLVVSGCAALMVAFLLETPTQFARNISSYYWIMGVQAASAPADSHDSPVVRKPVVRTSPEAITVEESDPVVEVVFEHPDPPEALDPVPVQPPAPPFTVVKDDVYLYTLNHADSPVVVTLPRGEIVEPQMHLNESGQEWSYVTAPALHVSGYLQSDCLEIR